MYIGDKEKKSVTLPHSAQRKHAFLGEMKQIPKSNKIAPRKKVALELLHHRLGHRSTRLLMYGDTSNVGRTLNLG